MVFYNRSYADSTRSISKSIFVTNFPDVTSAKELWRVCQTYGTVIDVFIPNRLSRAGKHFAFVCFIRVENVDRLVGNLCTLWIGSMHLQANVARFERPSVASPRDHTTAVRDPRPLQSKSSGSASFVSVLQGNGRPSPYISPLPAMVLDDACLVERDLENFVMGELKSFSSIPNIRVLLQKEGFQIVSLSYLGGLWVMFELKSKVSKEKLLDHVGVSSWFHQICSAQLDFVAKERIVWIDIEGVPLHAWSRATFTKICSRWGEVMELEENKVDFFARKRICIKTKTEDNILEKFKVVLRGKVFVIRVKELFVWSPVFKEVDDEGYCSDVESSKEGESVKGEPRQFGKQDNDSDEEEVVSETCFGDETDKVVGDTDIEQPVNESKLSSDPFDIYGLLRKQGADNIDKRVDNDQSQGADSAAKTVENEHELSGNVADSSIPFPPGFTPPTPKDASIEQEVFDSGAVRSHNQSVCSRILEDTHVVDSELGSDGDGIVQSQKKGGSILELLDDVVKVGQAMGFSMVGCEKDIEGLGSKAKKDWIRELLVKYRVNFLSLQETKASTVSDMDVKMFWGNSCFEYTFSEALGLSGGIISVWDPSVFHFENHTVSDNFIALYGLWKPTKTKLLVISVRWDGECLVMGDFNEVRCEEERLGTVFNVLGANAFNDFILNSNLLDVRLDGFSFTWSHRSASKMSKLDRFLISDGFHSSFPHMSGICLDRHLSDHRPILFRDVCIDYGATPFRLFHSWFDWDGFDIMVSSVWSSMSLSDSNGMVRFKKKLQHLIKEIRSWVIERKKQNMGNIYDIKSKLHELDVTIDQGGANADILASRLNLMKNLHDIKASEALDGEWVSDPVRVKEEFRLHFSKRFEEPAVNRSKISFQFPTRLNSDQDLDLERPVSCDEIRQAVWGCGEDKSPGPDGFTFEFFRKFWDIIGPDFCVAVKWFFDHSSFSRGCNSSFVALIPKNSDPKFVTDFRPISLIGCLYKVVTKILALRLSAIISGLISDVQTAFVPGRQILDGPFIINELLAWCKHYKHQAMVFKVDFAKAYDSVRWDYLMDVLKSFGFGDKWCGWIKGSLSASMASVLVNGSPTAEFQFFRGLKQGDPLAPYLFILVMESLHLSFSRTVDVGIFKGIQIGKDFTLSHLFYADDAVFIGEWSDENLSRILHVLHCFSLASGLKINVKKSHLLGVGVSNDATVAAATNLGCAIMKAPFKYLGVMVGGNMSRIDAWDETLSNLRSRLSKWKSKTLSIGGRLTLLKSVLGSSPIYAMSLYKVPKSVLSSMEAIRRNFFYGSQEADKNITWVKWSKVLAAKQFGGLGVSSLFSLNRALLMRWVWRFIFHDNSFWCRFISAVHGPSFQVRSGTSLWRTITSEVNGLKAQGVDILSHCLKRVGNGLSTKFWFDPWIVNVKLCNEFPRLFALELNKSISVAEKLQHSVDTSFRRPVRGGSESAQLESLSELIEGVILSNSRDRWFWDMNGSGTYRVKDVRNMLDDFFLPKDEVATRWLPHLPIKLNVFAWRLYLDRLPTKSNLIRRGIQVGSPICPNCISYDEDVPHIFFKCPLAIEVSRAVCRWWDVVWVPCGSYSEWLSWLLSIKMGSRIKSLFEGV
ncbi:RNA-directed DNA polymerase, eukaryota [Tanacetum coccineum]